MLKLEIKDDKSTDDQTLVFWLEKDEDGINLHVEIKGQTTYYSEKVICWINNDGKLALNDTLPSSLGLQLDTNGQIQLAN